MDKLLQLADLTGGTVSRVDPDYIEQDIRNITSDKILSKQALLHIQLSHHLEFRNQEQGELDRDGGRLTQNLLNPTVNTDLTFEYRFKEQM